MDFTLRQFGPRAGQRGTTKTISINKLGHNKATLVDDSGSVIAEFEIDRNGSFVSAVPGAGQALNLGQQPLTAVAPKSKSSMKGSKRNWRIEGDTFFIRPRPNSPDSAEIALALVDPGPFTPSGVPEVIGQHELLFSIALGFHTKKPSMLIGPTGIGKTTAYRWICEKLGYNLVIQPISRGTEAAHMVGEYLPAGDGTFHWTDGPVTLAARLAQTHPTLLIFDELNRIGNIAEFARLYQALDDSKILELKEKRDESGTVEVLRVNDLLIGATANPTDDEGADYIGTQELDPALNSRFPWQPKLSYPAVEVEAAALCIRVPALDPAVALKMVEAADRIRKAQNIRFPISFRELEAWAVALPYFDYKEAAEIAVVTKAADVFRKDIRNLLQLQGV